MVHSNNGNNLAADAYEEALPLLLRSMFWRPAYINRSAWLDHVPFAFWLVDAHRPKMLVELGTQFGASYFAFCQAVDRLGLDTNCYSVDTWKGDEHAGFYGEEVFAAVNAYNEARYSGFSRLVRSTFDDALGHFSDGTIDLLHIDGLHTFDAVAHDFESWLPKLTDDAVVIIHDTNVRERGFGVYKCFEGLREKYPSFEFVHGHGLGVLGVGQKQKPLLSQLFEAGKNPLLRRTVREIFSRLGSSCSQTLELQKNSTQKQKTDAKLAEVQSALAALKSASAARDAEAAEKISRLDAERARLFASLEAIGRGREQEAAAYEARVAQLELDLAGRAFTGRPISEPGDAFAYDAKVLSLECALAERAREVETLRQRLDDATAEAEAAAAAVARASDAEARAERLAAEVARLEASLAERFRELSEMGHLLQAKAAESEKLAVDAESRQAVENTEITRLGANVSDRFEELATLSRLLKEKTSEVEKLARSEALAQRRVKEAEAVAARRKGEIDRLESNVAERFREIAALSRLLKDRDIALSERQEDAAGAGSKSATFGRLAEINGKSISERLALVSGGAQEAASRLKQALEPLGGLRWRISRQRRLVSASGLFDAPWYLARNHDVAAAGADPLDHFLLFGGQEGRAPSLAFDSAAYLRQNPDVAASGLNPLVHYLVNGRAEGRPAAALR